MRVLISPVGSTGDVRPALALSGHLLHLGHEVMILTSRDFEPLLKKHSYPYVCFDYNYRELARPFGKLMGHPLRSGSAMLKGIQQISAVHHSKLAEILPGFDYYLSAGLQLSGLALAEKQGIPHRHIIHAPFWTASGEYSPPYIPWQFSSPLLNRWLWRWTERIQDWSLGPLLDRERREEGLPLTHHSLENYRKSMIFAMDPCLLTQGSDVSAHLQIPYPLLEEQDGLPPAVQKFLDKGDPPLFIGFGSMPDHKPDRLLKILEDFTDRTGRKIILQSGWGEYTGNVDSSLICICDQVEHSVLFPMTAGVIHHGGAGTVYSAARSGKPQIIVPHLLDQFYWGRRIESLGIGINAGSINQLSSRSLEQAVIRLEKDTEIGQAAEHLGQQLQKSIPEDIWEKILY